MSQQEERWFNKKDGKTYNYMGKRNKISKCNEEFVKICKLPQKQLKNYLNMFLYEVGYDCVVTGDGFLYAKGYIPFCLTAHMDTVHKETVSTVYELEQMGDYILSSPQGIGGDDRCGIYMIMNILRKGFKPYIVFCEDEEIGCVGSHKFCKTNLIEQLKECKYIIELDRANAKDAVFYDCDNPDFTEFITNTTGYTKEWGSCSDISYLCPSSGVAGVNLSCGYYNAHTLGEYVSMEEMANTQKVVEKLLNTECVAYEYMERKSYNYYGGYYGGYYGKYNSSSYDREWLNEWYDSKTYNSTKTKNETSVPESTKKDHKGKETCCIEIITSDDDMVYAYGNTFEEAWVEFFFNNPMYAYADVVDWTEYWL